MNIYDLPAYQKKERPQPAPITKEEAAAAEWLASNPKDEVITGTIRDIKGTQFRHWNEPTQSWWRCRGTHDLKIVTDALATDSPVRMTINGKQLKELELA